MGLVGKDNKSQIQNLVHGRSGDLSQSITNRRQIKPAQSLLSYQEQDIVYEKALEFFPVLYLLTGIHIFCSAQNITYLFFQKRIFTASLFYKRNIVEL